MAKSTGMTRKIDELGRIVLPMEIRKTLDIENRDVLEIFVEDDKIILKKYHPSCIFCENTEEVTSYKGKLVCKECLRALNKVIQ